MFWQLYQYRLKRLVNDKVQLFWTAMFPIVLGTFFYLAFSGISNREETLKSIAAAVVQQEQGGKYTGDSENAAAFQQFLLALSGEDGVLELSEEKDYKTATEQLLDGTLDGVIVLGENIRLEFSENGINQTILKNLVDRYLQGEQAITAAGEKGFDAVKKAAEAMFREGQNQEKSISESNMDPFAQYFFALMAMSCLFGASFGLINTQEIQADQTKVAVRRLVSPTRKGMAVATDFLAAFTVQMCAFFLLNFYLQLVLHINLGEQQGKIVLAGAAANLAGIALGYFIGVAVKGKPTVKHSIMMGTVLGLSFLSGLMQAGIKYLIEKYFPLINQINPAALTSDCFYHLSVSADTKQYMSCVIVLFAEAAVFGVLSTMIMRRERYKSL